MAHLLADGLVVGEGRREVARVRRVKLRQAEVAPVRAGDEGQEEGGRDLSGVSDVPRGGGGRDLLRTV